MNVIKQAEYAAKIRNEYVVVGHCTQFAVIKDENGVLYYMLDEKKVLDEGDVCDGTDLNTLDNLPEVIKRTIILWFGSEVG